MVERPPVADILSEHSLDWERLEGRADSDGSGASHRTVKDLPGAYPEAICALVAEVLALGWRVGPVADTPRGAHMRVLVHPILSLDLEVIASDAERPPTRVVGTSHLKGAHVDPLGQGNRELDRVFKDTEQRLRDEAPAEQGWQRRWYRWWRSRHNLGVLFGSILVFIFVADDIGVSLGIPRESLEGGYYSLGMVLAVVFGTLLFLLLNVAVAVTIAVVCLLERLRQNT